MIDDLLAFVFVVLWAISAACLWLLRASISAAVWTLKALLRFRHGWKHAQRQQEQRNY